MVGHKILDLVIMVRVHASQPKFARWSMRGSLIFQPSVIKYIVEGFLSKAELQGVKDGLS